MQRFFYSFPESRLGYRNVRPNSIPLDVKSAYRKLIIELLDENYPKRGGEPLTLTLSPEADAKFLDFLEVLELRIRDDREIMIGFDSKMSGGALRIAGILHSMKNWESNADGLIVSAETMEIAVDIAFYFMEHAKNLLLRSKADPGVVGAEYILEKFKEKGIKEFTRLELLKICRKFSVVAELDAPLSILEDCKYIRKREVYISGNKKTASIYYVNPLWIESEQKERE
jgi:hypothetical protein